MTTQNNNDDFFNGFNDEISFDQINEDQIYQGKM